MDHNLRAEIGHPQVGAQQGEYDKLLMMKPEQQPAIVVEAQEPRSSGKREVRVDAFSLVAARIEMRRGGVTLAWGSASIWQSTNDQSFLVTCWHNLTGMNPLTGKALSGHGARPDSIRVVTPHRESLMSGWVADVPLYFDNRPVWMVHRRGVRCVDIAAIPIPPLSRGPLAINKLHQAPIRLTVGTDVFVIGYPEAISRWSLPIWKRGSLSVDPDAIDDTEYNGFLMIDCASRKGMSGSVVVSRAGAGMYLSEDGEFVGGQPNATRVVGIYTGRLATEDQVSAQLGRFLPRHLVDEVIESGTVDDFDP